MNRTPLVIALLLSMTINLFLLGFGTARWLHAAGYAGHGPFAGSHPSMHHGGPGPGRELLRAVPEERRQALRTQRQHLRDAQTAVRDALSAEPLDRAALQQALTQLRQATADSQRLMHDALWELAPSLTLEQRVELARSGSLLGGAFPRAARD